VGEPQAPEAFLQVGDRLAGVTFAKRQKVLFARSGCCTAHRDKPRSGPIISTW
jgi:cytochrome c551/c552